ncbi:unnamed protein product [Vitrella brassicaformis CCMP3155]|uniref:Uncharacterized protein n=1 Tax=Vitrella brassicaformis (strain CCMP3155) TaxID=1169540 RepID=A0A0G4FK35_VITBC|nr:unnamed protein product [Vitrella brassicaformis CCMP3155]|eukprot:CEM13747.1 unnamed protein product [Vitrella brassicaformis CCMP3155]
MDFLYNSHVYPDDDGKYCLKAMTAQVMVAIIEMFEGRKADVNDESTLCISLVAVVWAATGGITDCRQCDFMYT